VRRIQLDYLAEAILLEREERVKYQEKLIKRFNRPLIMVRVNYPGNNKETDVSLSIIKIIDDALVQEFKKKLIFKLFRITSEGPILIMIVEDEAKKIKEVTIDIEEKHILGRCVDIDVYDENGIGLSRETLGRNTRKCFVCDEDAKICIREQKHTFWEVSSFILNRYGEYKKNVNR